MTKLIGNFKFPRGNDLIRLSECDFFINTSKSGKISDIPTTLKENSSLDSGKPFLILFYYNNISEKILENFSDMKENFMNGGNWETKLNGNNQPFNFGYVNLEYEKKIDETFKKMSKFNPFYWTRNLNTEKEHFIIFYYHHYPQYFYYKDTDPALALSIFQGEKWFKRINNNDPNKLKKFRNHTEHVTLNEGYYQYIGEEGTIINVSVYEYGTNKATGTTTFEFKKDQLFESVGVSMNTYTGVSTGLVLFSGTENNSVKYGTSVIYLPATDEDKIYTDFKKIDIIEEKRNKKSDVYKEIMKLENGKDYFKKDNTVIDKNDWDDLGFSDDLI